MLAVEMTWKAQSLEGISVLCTPRLPRIDIDLKNPIVRQRRRL